MYVFLFLQQHNRKNASNISVERPAHRLYPALPCFKRHSSSHFLAASLATVQLDYFFIFVFVLFVKRQHARASGQSVNKSGTCEVDLIVFTVPDYV